MTTQNISRKKTPGNQVQLQGEFGPLLGGRNLSSALGYASQAAFRQAFHRGTVPVRVFEIPGRRGKFALRQDVERWLSTYATLAEEQKGGNGEK